MKKYRKILEKFLYEIWKEKSFVKDLTTKQGEAIEVIDTGVENKDLSGPDFRNAKIKIGNITYSGDVEIDSDYSDWKAHGHSYNRRYNSVILHATLNINDDMPFVFTVDGRKIPSINLSDFLEENLVKSIHAAILSEREKRLYCLPCLENNDEVKDVEKLNFIYDLGKKRFNKKKESFFLRLKELVYFQELNIKEPVINYDFDESFYNRIFYQKDFNNKSLWIQLIYESIFEALGYSKNKDMMKALAKSADVQFLHSLKLDDNILAFEASLFRISGLMPDVQNLPDEETSAYTKKLHEIWNEIKPLYDGRTFHPAQWHFFRLRPRNFPTLRIAGGARLAYKLLNKNLIGQILDIVEKANGQSQLIRNLRSLFMVKSEGFWASHFVFDQAAQSRIDYFIGESRADEIIVNIILPIISLYFEIFRQRELSVKVIKLYLNYYQRNENNLVSEVSNDLHLTDAWHRSVLYQGMIELYRNYCSQEKCLECPIGEKVFA